MDDVVEGSATHCAAHGLIWLRSASSSALYAEWPRYPVDRSLDENTRRLVPSSVSWSCWNLYGAGAVYALIVIYGLPKDELHSMSSRGDAVCTSRIIDFPSWHVTGLCKWRSRRMLTWSPCHDSKYALLSSSGWQWVIWRGSCLIYLLSRCSFGEARSEPGLVPNVAGWVAVRLRDKDLRPSMVRANVQLRKAQQQSVCSGPPFSKSLLTVKWS